jgi:hypothetical protein
MGTARSGFVAGGYGPKRPPSVWLAHRALPARLEQSRKTALRVQGPSTEKGGVSVGSAAAPLRFLRII